MNAKLLTLSVLFLHMFILPCCAEDEDDLPEGLLTQYLNRGLERLMTPRQTTESQPENGETMQYGRDVTKWVSPPKFGGYLVGQYSYSDLSGAHSGNGFEARLIRAYVSGSVLKDFKYRLQLEMRNSVTLRDFWIEWSHWDEFHVKMGQFKRGFTFESPLNLWQVGLGDYSQVIRKLVGYGDYCGEPSMNGRDLGLQFYGNLLPIGSEERRLLRYEVAVMNGNGQNRTDNNRQKDFLGALIVRPLKGLRVGFYGWKGSYEENNVRVGRNRWALGASYEDRLLTARAEYIHHVGHRLSDYDAKNNLWNGTARADGWYACLGVAATRWLKPYLRYDVYRDERSWGSMTSTYSLAVDFQLHKDLMFLLQYNFVNDRKNPADQHYNQLWAQAYIRF